MSLVPRSNSTRRGAGAASRLVRRGRLQSPALRASSAALALGALGLVVAACGASAHTSTALPSSFDVSATPHPTSTATSTSGATDPVTRSTTEVAGDPGPTTLISSTAPAPGFTLSYSAPGGASNPAAVVPTTRPAGPLSSCTLLSLAEASAALGQNVSGPYKGTVVVDGVVTCVYDGVFVPPSTNPNVDNLDTVRVTLVAGTKAAAAYSTATSRDPGTAVSGLGASASFDGKDTLTALKGSYCLQISVIGAASTSAADMQLAKDALSYL